MGELGFRGLIMTATCIRKLYCSDYKLGRYQGKWGEERISLGRGSEIGKVIESETERNEGMVKILCSYRELLQ